MNVYLDHDTRGEAPERPGCTLLVLISSQGIVETDFNVRWMLTIGGFQRLLIFNLRCSIFDPFQETAIVDCLGFLTTNFFPWHGNDFVRIPHLCSQRVFDETRDLDQKISHLRSRRGYDETKILVVNQTPDTLGDHK